MESGDLNKDIRNTLEGQALVKYKSQLKAIRDTLLFGMDARTITAKNLTSWEVELRKMLRSIMALEEASSLYDLIDSPDRLGNMISRVITYLNLMEDILSSTPTIKKRERYYEMLFECSNILDKAIKEFRV